MSLCLALLRSCYRGASAVVSGPPPRLIRQTGFFFHLKIMILCGAKGPAKGGSLFKMASAAAVASAGPQESSTAEEEVSRPTGRTRGAETQTKVSSPAMRE